VQFNACILSIRKYSLWWELFIIYLHKSSYFMA
jgi:hypothetical protein